MLVVRVTEDHGAHSSIAYRQRLTLPVLGRLIVVQRKPLAVCDGGYDNSDEKGAGGNFHGPFSLCTFHSVPEVPCAIGAGGRQNVTIAV